MNILVKIGQKMGILSKPTEILASICIPGKRVIVKKISMEKDFFTYDGIKYYVNLSKIVNLEDKYYLFYKYGHSEPVDFSANSSEKIFSKELTNTLKAHIIKEFRSSEVSEKINEIMERVVITIGLNIVILVFILYVFLTVKGLREDINSDLENLKNMVVIK